MTQLRITPSATSRIIGYKAYVEKGITIPDLNSKCYVLGLKTLIPLEDLGINPNETATIGIVAINRVGSQSPMKFITHTAEEKNDMARVKSAILRFPPSPSTDVVGYKMYIEPVPTEPSYQSPSHDLGNNMVEVDGPGDVGITNLVEVDLSTIVSTIDSGIYNLGIASVDNSGNESDLQFLNNVELDFVAPEPPGALDLIRL